MSAQVANAQIARQYDVGAILRTARTETGLSLRDVARIAGTSHATLSAYEHNRKTPSVVTFLRVLEACRFSVDIALKPRVREQRGLPRGQELEEVLNLAEQFPAKPSRTLNYPIFGRR
jgi:transcriptional regulator with XRE-family HTH domain